MTNRVGEVTQLSVSLKSVTDSLQVSLNNLDPASTNITAGLWKYVRKAYIGSSQQIQQRAIIYEYVQTHDIDRQLHLKEKPSYSKAEAHLNDIRAANSNSRCERLSFTG